MRRPNSPDSTNCPVCTPWCATTKTQLKNRLANMRDIPTAKAYPCPRCGSMVWATTREFINEDVRPWWQHLMDWIKQ